MDVSNNHLLPFESAPADLSPDLDVGVIYTGERDLLVPLLETAARSADGIRVRLVLVDNASGDELTDFLHYFPDTRVVTNDSRLTYAENLNRVIEHSDAPLVLALNTDMTFGPESQCLARMVEFMRQNPDCGVSGCQIYHPDGSYGFPARRFQSLRIIAARRLGLSRLLAGDLEGYLYQEFDRTDSFECEWLSGCFLMMRREALGEAGLFDVAFRKYKEDVDFCLRMAIAGWQVMFCGDTFVYHHEQRASQRLISRDALIHVRSYVRWLRKWGFNPRRKLEISRQQRLAGGRKSQEEKRAA
jgi:GT2 family glycosyltransferase